MLTALHKVSLLIRSVSQHSLKRIHNREWIEVNSKWIGAEFEFLSAKSISYIFGKTRTHHEHVIIVINRKVELRCRDLSSKCVHNLLGFFEGEGEDSSFPRNTVGADSLAV